MMTSPILHKLHKTLADASEVMAAFVSTLRSREESIESMVAALDKSIDELAFIEYVGLWDG